MTKRGYTLRYDFTEGHCYPHFFGFRKEDGCIHTDLSEHVSDMYCWCSNQFGRDSDSGWSKGLSGFYFRDKNQALSFKMRWG